MSVTVYIFVIIKNGEIVSANITIFKLDGLFGFNDDKHVTCNTKFKMHKSLVTTHHHLKTSTYGLS